MASKRNSRTKTDPKSKAILTLILIACVAALCVYTVFVGLGKQHKGSAKNIKLGLDLAGGVSITYEVSEKNPTETQMNDTIYKLQQRVDNYSTEAEVYKEGKNRITVEIPGVTDANKILKQLGKPGNLAFVTQDGQVILTGSNIKKAEAETTNDNGKKDYVVALSMDSKGAQAFGTATAANIGKPIYIIYDNKVVSAPNVEQAITDGECVIENMGSFKEADNLASTIRIGALPLTLKELRSNVVGAKLGRNAIKTSLQAGAVGLILILIFMTAIYRLPGFLSGIALMGFTVLDLLAINGFNATLTLPGIAGVLLTIGMAVDANVIIFSRIKEEIRDGKSVGQAIDSGYHKALSAILDGNITTLIAAVVLWKMGSGTVKGFAQTLFMGVVLSMFTALFVIKQLMTSLYNLGCTSPALYGKAKPVKVHDYIKYAKYCIAVSCIIIAIGIIALPVNNKRLGSSLNYDLEFSGGTAVTMTFNDDTKITNDLEKQVEDAVRSVVDVKKVESQKVLNSNQLVVKTNELKLSERQKLESSLKKTFTNMKDYQTEEITASVSNEMRRAAIIAVIVAAIFMLLYIWVRFKNIRFGTSAVLALLHDVFFTFMVYSVFRLSVGNTFIACMLTILGYSINATIVIFDRIRENLKIPSVAKEGNAYVVNLSISQTLTRSINTTLTSFITVALLYIMGVASIKEFTLTLMVGLIVGAYSSVCITGPLWFFFNRNHEKKLAAERAAKKKKKR
ncbi:MAG: protein translocase subunit SecD [Lachnospiraceae bacterium]|nr:protein translocase subunit SecD [Lachnospiraceae bacterium]